MTPPVAGLRGERGACRRNDGSQMARDLGGPAEFVLPGLGALIVALLLFTGLRGSRRARTA